MKYNPSLVSIVVPTKNEGAGLLRILNSVKPYAKEIIVVDGHSTDNTFQIVRGTKAKYLPDHGLGRGDGVRTGLAKASGKVAVLFDTDGSVYKLKFGIQISFSNRSQPLLCSFRKMLVLLDYQPSRISGPRVYLTRIPDIKRFFEEIKPKNTKHVKRFEKFIHAPVG